MASTGKLIEGTAPRKMRYAFLSAGSWQNNPSCERLRRLAEELTHCNVECFILLDDCPFNRTVVIPEGVRGILIQGYSSLSRLIKRRSALRSLSVDWVHVLNTSPNTAITLLFSGDTLVADWDEWSEIRTDHRFPLFIERMLATYMRRRARKTVVCSRYMQEEFVARFGVQSAYIPYAPLESAVVLSGPSETPFRKPTAVYMGSLHSQYDHDLLFSAAIALKKQRTPVQMCIFGSGPESAKWQEFVSHNELDFVHLPGRLSDEERWRYLSHAHVLLFPIRATPGNLARCPFKLYFYAQSRRPVITCRVGEVPAVLGEKAVYIEPTAEAFATAIYNAARKDQPHVDYDLRDATWARRAEDLLHFVNC